MIPVAVSSVVAVGVWVAILLLAVGVVAFAFWRSRPAPADLAPPAARTLDDELADADFDWFGGAA